MPVDRIAFRTDPRIKARIEELVQQGDCRNVSEFVNQALRLKFVVERIPIEFEPAAPGLLEEFFDSPPGRRILREVICGPPLK